MSADPSSVENQALHAAMSQWMRAALSMLSRQSVPFRVGTHVTFIDAGYRVEGIPQPDYLQLLHQSIHALLQLEEYRGIRDVVTGNPLLSVILTHGDSTQPETDARMMIYLKLFLAEYVKIAPIGRNPYLFDAVNFERVYTQLESYIYATAPFDAVWYLSIRNLRLDASVELEQGLILRPAHEREQIEAVQEPGSFTQMAHWPPTAIVEYRQQVARDDSIDTAPALAVAHRIVFTLRLLHESPIVVDTYRFRLLDQPFHSFSSFSGGLFVTVAIHPPYILTDQRAAELATLWPHATRSSCDPALETAVTRLDDAYSRFKDEDKLVDYWIALESLFFPKDEQVRALRFAVALAISHYLGATSTERDDIYDDILLSYRWRSYLVHGKRGNAPDHKNQENYQRALKYYETHCNNPQAAANLTPPIPPNDLDKIVGKTGGYLRMALRKRIQEL